MHTYTRTHTHTHTHRMEGTKSSAVYNVGRVRCKKMKYVRPFLTTPPTANLYPYPLLRIAFTSVHISLYFILNEFEKSPLREVVERGQLIEARATRHLPTSGKCALHFCSLIFLCLPPSIFLLTLSSTHKERNVRLCLGQVL